MKEKKARQEPIFFPFVKSLSALKQNWPLFFFLVVDIFRLISLPAFEMVFEIFMIFSLAFSVRAFFQA